MDSLEGVIPLQDTDRPSDTLEGVIPLQAELTKNKVLHEYVLAGAGVPDCTNFIETKAFHKLKTMTLDDKTNDPILLLGPKGCGKTLSLVALLTILLNVRKSALYLTSKTLRSIHTYTILKYTKQFFEDTDKSDFLAIQKEWKVNYTTL